MRGKDAEPKGTDQKFGITPAYAGKSKRQNFFGSCGEDHPRLCGEKDVTNGIHFHVSGSPPPMRGKVIHYYKYFSVAGITPAYAGKSTVSTSQSDFLQDHPRLCGEKVRQSVWRSAYVGSPPPMRGKGCAFGNSRYRLRITPAYAGKRQTRAPCGLYGRDHPRLCGEKLSDFSMIAKVLGSPPPMRGKGRMYNGY